MKKALWVLILTLLVVTVCFATTLCFAYADEDEPVPQATYVTQDYVELGRILSLSACGERLAAVEVKDETLSIVVLSDKCVRVSLPDGLSPDPAAVRLALGRDTLLVDLGADALYAYDLTEGTWAKTALVTTLSETLQVTPLTAFAVDSDTDVLYMGYGATLLWVDLADALGETVPYDVQHKRHNFDPSTHSYNLMKALDNTCYFFNTTLGTRFVLNPVVDTAPSAVGTVAAFDDYAPNFYLRSGSVWKGDNRLLQKAGEDDYEDAVLYAASALAATDTRLYVADNGQSAVKVYDLEGNLVSMWGTWGESNGRLHSPTALSVDRSVVVNDRGNGRVAIYDPEGGAYSTIDVTADKVATYGAMVYIARGQLVDIYDLSKTGTARRRTLDLAVGNALSLAADATGGYAVVEGNLYSLGQEATEWASVKGAYQVKVGKHVGVVYVLGKDAALTCYKDGLLVEGVNLSLAGIGLIDWTTDLYGNVYALTDSQVLRYTRTADGFGEPSATPLAGYHAIEIAPDGTVYALKDHALLKVDLDVPTEESSYQPPVAESNVGVRAIKLNVNEVWGYTSPDNYESIVCVTHPYAMLVATVGEGEDRFWYAECTVKGEEERYPYVYIPYDKAALVEDKVVDLTVKYNGILDQTGLYEFPSNQARSIASLPKGQAVLHAKRIVAVEAEPVWAWYEVDYESGSAYVRIADYTVYEDPNLVTRYYVKAKAGRLGDTIALYSAASVDSDLLASLVDGTRLELHEPFDPHAEWTKVYVDGQEGWVKTVYLSQSKLTNGQIIALVLAGVAVVAAAVTLLLYKVVKGKRK